MLNILAFVLILKALQLQALPEESYILNNVPEGSEDALSYFYVEPRNEINRHSDTSRRSTLEKNFARFGRGDLPALQGMEYEWDDGNSDFVRFGRNQPTANKLLRALRTNQQSFVRFGRSGFDSTKDRDKRAIPADSSDKRGDNSNGFIRFGRGKDNFMRFGRNSNNNDILLLKMLMQMLEKQKLNKQSV